MTDNGVLIDADVLQRRGRTRRKRFLAVSVAGLAVLAAALGVSFLGTTGSTSASVSGGGSNSYVFPVAKSGGFGSGAPSAITSLVFGSSSSAGTVPSWNPTLNSAGSVTTFGDLALVDPSGGNSTGGPNGVILTAYITNLADLQQNYSSFALPLDIWKCASSCSQASNWSQDSSLVSNAPTYLTSTEGYVSFKLPAGAYYDVTMDNGTNSATGAAGSYYDSGSTSGDYSPSFYFSAQPY